MLETAGTITGMRTGVCLGDMSPPPRRFPIPWIVVEIPGGYLVDDASGRTGGWFYGEDEPSRRAAMNCMTRDEARRMAVNFTKPPMLRKHSRPDD